MPARVENLKKVAKGVAQRTENFLVHTWRLKSVLLVGLTAWAVLLIFQPFSGPNPAPQHWTILWTLAKLSVGVFLGYIWIWELAPTLDPGKLIAEFDQIQIEIKGLLAEGKVEAAGVKALELRAHAELTKAYLTFLGALFAILIFVICIW